MLSGNGRRRGHVYRSRSKTIVSIVFGLVGFVMGLGTVIERHDRPVSVLLWSVVLVVSVFLGGRGAWSGVFTSDEGVHVANVFRSFDLSWREIERFEVGRWKFFPYVCLIHTVEGEVVPAIGVEEKTRFPNGTALQMTSELNAELLERTRGRRHI